MKCIRRIKKLLTSSRLSTAYLAFGFLSSLVLTASSSPCCSSTSRRHVLWLIEQKGVWRLVLSDCHHPAQVVHCNSSPRIHKVKTFPLVMSCPPPPGDLLSCSWPNASRSGSSLALYQQRCCPGITHCPDLGPAIPRFTWHLMLRCQRADSLCWGWPSQVSLLSEQMDC